MTTGYDEALAEVDAGHFVVLLPTDDEERGRCLVKATTEGRAPALCFHPDPGTRETAAIVGAIKARRGRSLPIPGGAGC